MKSERQMKWAEWIEILRDSTHYEIKKGQKHQAVVIDNEKRAFKLMPSPYWISMHLEGDLFKYSQCETSLNITKKLDALNDLTEESKSHRYKCTPPKEEYDFVNPDHYKKGGKEVIEMMIDVWGEADVIKYCEMNAFKYRMRMGSKPNQPVEQELKKALWYENKAKELREVLKTQSF
jgi:hypothetical protein